jgi:hypothetical protein
VLVAAEVTPRRRIKRRSAWVTSLKLSGERSEDRADRLRQQYEGTRPWTGSHQGMNDVIAPDRSGGMGPVTNGPRQTGLRKDEPWSPNPVGTTPIGGGLSEGIAAKLSSTSQYWGT